MARKTNEWLTDETQRTLFAQRIAAAAQQSGMSRRQFLHALGLGGASAILAACGGTAEAPVAPSSAPAAPAATTAPAAAATTAPAAAAPTAASAAAPTAASAPVAATTAPAAPTAGASAAGAAPDDKQVLRIAYNVDPASHDFNKDLYNGGESTLFAGLTRLSPDYEALPYAAESWTVSSDGTVYTFKINQKGKWTNGDPVTAEDFVYSFTRQLDPATAASYAAVLYDIKGAEEWNAGKGGSADKLGLKAIDQSTLEITLKGPREYFPLLVGYASTLPAHKASVEKYGDKWTEAGNIVSNGPFKLVSWEHGKTLEFERNEDFALAPKPKIKKILGSIIPNNAGVLPYESDELDWRQNQGIPASEIARLQGDPQLGKELVRSPQSATAFLSPEIDKPPFDQLGVRQALQHALDRETILKVIYELGEPAYSFISPDLPYAISPNEYPEFKQGYTYDPELALSKLKGTPYEGGKNWPEVTLSLRPVGPTIDLVGQVVQEQLAKSLGLQVKVENPGDSRVYITNVFDHKYQLPLYVWFADYPDPSNFYYALWYSKAQKRRFVWKNEQLDGVADAIAGELDKTKRAAQVRQAEQILLDNAAYIPLYYAYGVDLFKFYISGVPQNKAGVPVTDKSIYRLTKTEVFITDAKA